MNIKFDMPRSPFTQFANDRRFVNFILVAASAIGVLLLLGAFMIWPYVFSWAGVSSTGGAEAEHVHQMGRALYWLCGGVTLVQLAAGGLIFWHFDSELYSGLRTAVILYLLGFVLYAVGAQVFGIVFFTMTVDNGIGAVFSVLINGILALLLAFLPSFIIALLTYLARIIIGARSRRFERTL
jgi:hypothetical protein